MHVQHTASPATSRFNWHAFAGSPCGPPAKYWDSTGFTLKCMPVLLGLCRCCPFRYVVSQPSGITVSFCEANFIKSCSLLTPLPTIPYVDNVDYHAQLVQAVRGHYSWQYCIECRSRWDEPSIFEIFLKQRSWMSLTASSPGLYVWRMICFKLVMCSKLIASF